MSVTKTEAAGTLPERNPADPARPLLEHLKEARGRILAALALYGVLAVLCFLNVQPVVEHLLSLAQAFHFVYLTPSELLMSYMRLALVLALAADAPFIVYQGWAFARPALTEREKAVIRRCLLGGFVFFLLGIYFGYRIVLPFMLRFLAEYNSLSSVSASISVDSYISFVLNMLLVFGVIFELPVLTAMLAGLGILKPAYLIRARKYAILVIFILAAVITPPDVVSQIMVAVPMVLLYQLSILICRSVSRVRGNAQQPRAGQ